MIEYSIEKETCCFENEKHCLYSIIVKNDGMLIEKISMAFSDKHYAEKIVLLCNSLQLSPVHIYEVVENAVYDYSMNMSNN